VPNLTNLETIGLETEAAAEVNPTAPRRFRIVGGN